MHCFNTFNRQNHKVLEETRPLDARPNRWKHALVSANLVPSYGLNSSTVLWMERETPLSNLRCLAAYPFMGKASGENPEDKSSLEPVKSFLCFQENLIPEAKGEITLTETLSAEVEGAGS